MRFWKAKASRTTMAAALGLLFVNACSTTPDTAPSVVEKPAVPSTPVYVLDDILGASPDQVDALLGAPTLTRREGEGEYRRYALQGCTLIVILYPDETGAERATHVDAAAHTSGAEKPDLGACLARG